jgi:AraC-like DNA-binding protein
MPLGKDLEAVTSYYELLKRMVTHNLPNSLEAARHLTLALFYAYTGLKHQKHIASTKRERKDEIYDQFIELVREYYKSEREIGFYAEKMYITPKYLSSTTTSLSGMSASKIIDSYVVFQIKLELYMNTRSVKDISKSLNFQSQSFFGRYFKRVTGMSPREYINKYSIKLVETNA